jgi:DNA-cytosine methyltransferase
MLKLLDLFSGIGGFSLGLESTGGFETIAFVEKDDFCQKVLKKHWPNTTIEGDIRNVKGDKYEADVITGGFPCQPFSVAGKRKGVDDDRYLWDETIRVVRECKPRWFIGENVEGLININNGLVLRQVQTDLEKEGFEVQCLIIPASGIGAWHQRKRIWIVAYSNSNGHRNKIERSNGEKKKLQDQHRQNNSASWQSGGTSTIWNANGEYVSNSHDTGNRTSQYDIDGKWKKINERWEKFSQSKFNGYSENVSNSISTGSRRGRISGNIDKQRRNAFKTERESIQSKNQQTCSDDVKQNGQDVSNSDSIGYRGWSIKRCTTQGWTFFPREQEGRKMGSKIEGCNEYVSNSNDKGSQRFDIESSVSKQKLGFTSNKNDEGRETWWQTESRICGVPNGVSFELDKDRNNRIKSLGNSIVPQIVRELGFAILESEK